jgi:HEAT repeats/PBS lyase HEAT-like repeat
LRISLERNPVLATEQSMATRESLDDKLAAIRKLRGQSLSAEQKAELRKRIGDRSNLVVAAAAAIVGENTLVELARDLEAAFDRFLVNPLKDDKLCRAKVAVIQALDKMEHQEPDVFYKAVRHVQFEPVWGGSEDSAPPLRAAAVIALARIEGSRALPRLVDAMTDAAKDVRIASAVALGAVGTEAAGLLLRLKARIGDRDPEVLSECLSGLLAVDPKENLPIVAEFLEPGDAAKCEAAALALGKSRLPEALDPLQTCWPRCYSPDVRQQVLLAIAMLRLPIAIDYLMGLVATESEPNAIEALSALRIHNYDPRLCERIAKLLDDKGSATLRDRFDRDFRGG